MPYKIKLKKKNILKIREMSCFTLVNFLLVLTFYLWNKINFTINCPIIDKQDCWWVGFGKLVESLRGGFLMKLLRIELC